MLVLDASLRCTKGWSNPGFVFILPFKGMKRNGGMQQACVVAAGQ
jgi:hypothetical protein